jgi:hypothetical protein
MGWESRGNGSYFYRKEWQNGRCISTYLGRADWVGYIETLEAARREEAEAEREAECRALALMQAEDDKAAALSNDICEIVKATLQALGFHQHKRMWRKKRMAKQKATALAKTEEPEILVRNNRADRTPEDVEALRKLYEAKPELRRFFGNGLEMAFANLLAQAKLPLYEQDAIKLQAKEMRAALSEPDDSPLVTMLISHALLCWLRLGIIERGYTCALFNDNRTIKTALFWEKQLSAAQKRFTRAVECLARTRKLLRPGKPKLNIGTANVLVNQA